MSTSTHKFVVPSSTPLSNISPDNFSSRRDHRDHTGTRTSRLALAQISAEKLVATNSVLGDNEQRQGKGGPAWILALGGGRFVLRLHNRDRVLQGREWHRERQERKCRLPRESQVPRAPKPIVLRPPLQSVLLTIVREPLSRKQRDLCPFHVFIRHGIRVSRIPGLPVRRICLPHQRVPALFIGKVG
jgi:hypothetical protein